MSATITIGWWIVPAFISLLAVLWFNRQDYSGDYNFNAVITAPVAALVICFAWMVYFGIGWWLS